MHPVLAEFGWEYVQLIVWDKGLAHIAGNVNGQTIRQFPVVTEVCAFYQRTFTVTGPERADAAQAVGQARMGQVRAVAAAGERGVRGEERGHSQVPDQGLAMVLAAGR